MDVLPLNFLARACDRQLRAVVREWPNGIPLTEESVDRAVAMGLDLDWAAEHIMPCEATGDKPEWSVDSSRWKAARDNAASLYHAACAAARGRDAVEQAIDNYYEEMRKVTAMRQKDAGMALLAHLRSA